LLLSVPGLPRESPSPPMDVGPEDESPPPPLVVVTLLPPSTWEGLMCVKLVAAAAELCVRAFAE
jgi:hypothetical protein